LRLWVMRSESGVVWVLVGYEDWPPYKW